MTEVPDYLLRRSKERREALGLAPTGGSSDEGGGSAPAPAAESSAPASDAAATPVPAASAPATAAPVTDDLPSYIEPAAPRSGVPVWMMPVLVILPLWAIVYMGAFGGPAGGGGPAHRRPDLRSAGCGGCHGPGGEGGVGPALAGGETKLTFPNEADHVKWVEDGSQTGQGQALRRPRPGGKVAATGGMPAFKGQLVPRGDQGRRHLRARAALTSSPAHGAAGPVTHDVLVVGGGPAGAACAYWLAEAGHDVLVVEKKRYPRVKTCGDGLTPRAVQQLDDMGLTEAMAGHHRFDGLRSVAFGRVLELEWPETPGISPPRLRDHPPRPRRDGGRPGRRRPAPPCGRAPRPWLRCSRRPGAPGPWCGRPGRSRRRSGPRYVVVADGANSRFGRALGTQRDRSYPQGMAIRGYFTSPRHDEPWIESHLDIRDANGHVLPGYGWIFPLGDGRVNVGVGLLSTFRQYKSVNTVQADGVVRGLGARVVGHLPGDVVRAAHRRPSPDGPLHRALGRAARGWRSATRPAPSTRSTARASPTPTRPAGTRRRRSTAALAGDAAALRGVPPADRGRVRALLQGGPRLRQGHRPARPHAGAGRHGHALPHPDGVGAAHHGQPAAPRGVGAGRGRLPGPGRHCPPGPDRSRADLDAAALAASRDEFPSLDDRRRPERFEELVADALDSIPAGARPAHGQRLGHRSRTRPRRGLLGLYEGVPLTERDAGYAGHGHARPHHHLPQGHLRHVPTPRSEVVDQVRQTP